MIVPEFVRRVREEVEKRKRALEDKLGRGSAASYDEYKLSVGHLRGLAEIDEILRGVTKQMEVDADE